jgi:uncharacterized protein (TIGR00369 family)
MNPLAASPFSAHLGLQVVEWSPGKAVVSVEITDSLKNRRGDAHGGVTATLLDAALGIACQSHSNEWKSEGTVTLNVQFIEPARGTLRAEALSREKCATRAEPSWPRRRQPSRSNAGRRLNNRRKVTPVHSEQCQLPHSSERSLSGPPVIHIRCFWQMCGGFGRVLL